METLVICKKAQAHHEVKPGRGAQKNKGLRGVVSAQDVADATYETIDLGPYKKHFGAVAANFDMMLHGQPGAGKTYFLLKFANWLANNLGRVLYVSTEEFGSVTLTNKINETGATSSNLFFAKSINGVDLSQYDFVVLDSVNDAGLKLDTYKDLRDKHPGTAFILILQKTKDGNFKGGKEWEHEVEIAGELTKQVDDKGKTNRFLHTYKNRYGVYDNIKI